MNERIYRVPVHTEEGDFTVIAKGITPNDARIRTALLLERIYSLPPARWEPMPCGKWIRSFACTENPRDDFPCHDGFMAAILKPEVTQ